ncbi:MAG: hypothetical protein Q7V88_00495 [Actinomycetota bacterium]|nr:hypothetical protein [Actinomycetota bacterium]
MSNRAEALKALQRAAARRRRLEMSCGGVIVAGAILVVASTGSSLPDSKGAVSDGVFGLAELVGGQTSLLRLACLGLAVCGAVAFRAPHPSTARGFAAATLVVGLLVVASIRDSITARDELAALVRANPELDLIVSLGSYSGMYTALAGGLTALVGGLGWLLLRSGLGGHGRPAQPSQRPDTPPVPPATDGARTMTADVHSAR